MIRITSADFEKLKKVLDKEAMPGAILSFRTVGATLEVEIVDRSNHSLTVTLCDQEYSFMPTITRTQTL